MNNQKGIASLLAVIIVIVVGVVVIGGVLAYQYLWAPEEKVEVGEEAEAPKDETADWKVYRNEEYGFEVKYPETINSIPIVANFNKFSPVGGTNVTLGDDFPVLEGFIGSTTGKWTPGAWLEGKVGISFLVSVEPVEDLEKYVKRKIDIYKSDPDYYKELINLFFADYSEINLDNTIGYATRLRFGNEDDYDDQISIYIQNSKHLFMISYVTGYGMKDEKDYEKVKRERLEIIEKIISTFKFIEIKEPKEAYIKVLSPNGGEEWEVGKTYKIKWDYEGNDNNFVNIELWDGESGRLVFASGISASQKYYDWKVPTTIGSNYLAYWETPYIYVGLSDTIPYIGDRSDDYFSIVKKTADWNVYKNTEYGYEVKYPEDVDIIEHEKSVFFEFSDEPGLHKSFQVIILEDVVCSKVKEEINESTKEIVEINDIEFLKTSGVTGGTESKDYSEEYNVITDKDECLRIVFSFMGSRHSEPTFDEVFDLERDTEIFNGMLSTFKFID